MVQDLNRQIQIEKLYRAALYNYTLLKLSDEQADLLKQKCTDVYDANPFPNSDENLSTVRKYLKSILS